MRNVIRQSEKYGSEYMYDNDGVLLFRPLGTDEEFSEVDDRAFSDTEQDEFYRHIEVLFDDREVFSLRDRLIELGDEDFVEFEESQTDDKDTLYSTFRERLTDYHAEEFAKGGDIIEDLYSSQEEEEKGKTFKKYRVFVYEKKTRDGMRVGDYQFADFKTDNILEAMDFGKNKMKSQRAYRSNTDDMYVTITQFVPIRERKGNPIYAYERLLSFDEEDLKNSPFPFEKGGLTDSKRNQLGKDISNVADELRDNATEHLKDSMKFMKYAETLQREAVEHKEQAMELNKIQREADLYERGGKIPQKAIDEFYQLRSDDEDFAEQYSDSEEDLREWYEEQGKFAKGGRVMSVERLAQKLERAYPRITMGGLTSNGISIFEPFPTDRNGDSIANYYSESQDRTFGVINHFNNFLERNGFYAEWQNPEHLRIYKKDYAEGGSVEDKEYVLERYYVYVHRDSYEQGETDMVHSWDSSDYGDNDKTFSSKSALMNFIKEVIDRDTYEDNVRDDSLLIESDDEETTIDYSVLCKYNDLDRGYDHYEKASDEEIEQWKKGNLELFSVGFTFKVKVYEPRKKAEFSKGGRVSKIDRDIRKFKTQLINKAKRKGIYENFGQNEVRKIQEKYDMYERDDMGVPNYQKLQDFNNWAMNYEPQFERGGVVEQIVKMGGEYDLSNMEHSIPNRAIRYNKDNSRYEIFNYMTDEVDYSDRQLEDILTKANRMFDTNF